VIAIKYSFYVLFLQFWGKKINLLFYGCKSNQNIWNSQAFACYFFKLLASDKTLISKQEIWVISLWSQPF